MTKKSQQDKKQGQFNSYVSKNIYPIKKIKSICFYNSFHRFSKQHLLIKRIKTNEFCYFFL